ncbi:hypothetical protein O1R50_05030 [Glycomyces luteolus]|uniref:TPR repeat domain-containing protein n=1 Tax=Glycomyces luteolus TaxID=2670330 RepID=A0A9X3P8N4_9ACTN|nr:hypothetical protein [Glycomyces luteolus]MDA1358973.1 hypothetical protein [Glycomyces luteolus]
MPSIPTAASLSVPESKADVGTLREGATEFESKSGAIIGRGSEVVAQMKSTAVEFTELVSEQLKSRGTESIEAARTAMQGSVWGGAVTGKWADAAETYQQIAASHTASWNEAVRSGFGVTAESAGVTAGMPGDVASKIMDNKMAEAGAEQLAAMQGAVNAAYEKYKDEAKLAGTRLQQGPTPANLRALSGGGTTTWALFNAFGLKAGIPPLDGADGKRLAEALIGFLAGDDDAIPPALRTQIDNLLAIARHAQGIQDAGKQLDPGQLDFLQQLFKGLDIPANDNNPNGGTVFEALPHWLKARDVSGADQTLILGAFGGGLLAMTNEKIGGGFGRLPESLRDTLGYYSGKVDNFNVHTLHDQLIALAPYLGATTAKQIGLGRLEGGKEFSAALTFAVADFYSEVTRRRPAYEVPFTDLEEFAPHLLEASTRNTDVNHELLTGKIQHPDIGKHTPEYLVRALFGNTWDKDAGKAAAGLIDWIGTDAGSNDPATKDRATEAAYALFTTMTDRDNTSGLFDKSAYDFFTDSYGKIGSFENAPIGAANGAITYSMAKAAVPYLDYFAETDTGGKDQLFMSKDPKAADMYLSQQTREDFVELIMGGDASRDKFGAEVYRNVLLDAHYADSWKDTEEANDEAMRTGRLMGLLDTGFQRVFDDANVDANAKTSESTQHASWARAGAAAVKEVVTELPFVRGLGRGAQQIIRQVAESFKWTPGVVQSYDLVWEKGVAPKAEDFDRKGDPSYEQFNFAVTHTVIEQQLKDTDSGITIEDIRQADSRLVEQDANGKWQLRPADELMKIHEPSGKAEDKGMYTYSDAERELHRLLEQKLKDKVDKFNNSFNLQRKDTGG